MIKANFVGTPELLKGFWIYGHADYDEPGKDIVCSAVSSLSITCGQSLMKILPGHVSTGQLDEEGFLFVKLCFIDDLSKEELRDAQVILNTLVDGLTATANQYPENLQVALQEVK